MTSMNGSRRLLREKKTALSTHETFDLAGMFYKETLDTNGEREFPCKLSSPI